MKSLPESIAQARHLTADLLRADMDLAMTFLQTAKISQVEETIIRNQNNARKAYDLAIHVLATNSLDPSDCEAVQAKVSVLRTALEETGQTF